MQMDGYHSSGTRSSCPGCLAPHAPAAKSGVYIYGDVGRGKSMLMDLFFGAVNIEKKRRVHFHQFMLEIHARLHQLQTEGADDVLPAVAADIAAETSLLCFDEFHVSNIADAMILGRLFSALFDQGVIVVATSNWAPDELYKNGLQRERFYPFIDLIKRKMIKCLHHLDGETLDHRYEQLRTLNSYFSPLNDETTHKLQGIFHAINRRCRTGTYYIAGAGDVQPQNHACGQGRWLFQFWRAMRTASMGAADYLAIAESVCIRSVLDGVPKIERKPNNAMKRCVL